MGGIGHFFSGIFGGNQGATVSAQPTAQPAAPVSQNTANAETGDVSNSAAMRKRAKGKSSLTINQGSSAGGTGLNV